ncbi:MAG: sporulation protein YqfC [Firmicutes bacterium]|jgi:sporulation protein YqfC|nr:sporulation protein YqfC [Bacillota bacterium]MDH7495018.1 sporulation protein YqfC [Bacillota bacterium]
MRGGGVNGMAGRVEEKLADFFEIPKNVLLDMPKLVVMGNVQLCVENHQGLIEYSQERVRVATSRGEVSVEGRDLSISRITKTELTVEGRIYRVTLWE